MSAVQYSRAWSPPLTSLLGTVWQGSVLPPVLYRTVLYCTVLYCTVLWLYLDERRGVQENSSMRSRELQRLNVGIFLRSPTLRYRHHQIFKCDEALAISIAIAIYKAIAISEAMTKKETIFYDFSGYGKTITITAIVSGKAISIAIAKVIDMAITIVIAEGKTIARAEGKILG